ncbi:MAG: hypothetical protein H6983_23440 [Ectothiorhodospiraceae bacterium]|nr:hypothetical protein [Chromatiales bacterium]MCP5157152.1 hypothetical protein [Ectothiorhodospiraceae bacterium]
MHRGFVALFPPLLVCLAPLVVYLIGADGPFLLDDYAVIVNEPALAMRSVSMTNLLDAFFSASEPFPRRGLARLSFALDHYLVGGFDPYSFKLNNILIHCANGALVYFLAFRLTMARGGDGPVRRHCLWLATMVALVWALHPLQLTAVLYVVQRMASLSATFMLVGLILFAIGRARLGAGRGGGLTLMVVGIAGGTSLGYLCKQNAVLLPFLALLLELFFFARDGLPGDVRRRLAGFWVIFALVPAVIGAIVLVWKWDYLGGAYQFRDFTVWERLLTQARALWFYVSLLVVPDISAMGIYHDDFEVSRGWWTPWTTVPSVLAWLGIAVAAAWWGIRRRQVWAFAVLWFLTGHAVESSFLGLELVFEHRNYLPALGVVYALVHYGALGLRTHVASRRLWSVSAAAVVLALAVATGARAWIWGEPRRLAEAEYQNHPRSFRAAQTWAGYLVARGGDPREAWAALGAASALNRGRILTLIEMAKLARTLELGLRTIPTQPGAVNNPGGDAWLEMPLVLDASWLGAVGKVIDGEIRLRLRTEPVVGESIAAIGRLVTCAEQGVEACVDLVPRMMTWTEIALANPRMAASSRASLSMLGALVQSWRGQPDKAMELARAAVAAEPRNPKRIYEWARLALSLDRRAEARDALKRLDGDSRWAVSRARMISELEAMLGARKQVTD